MSLAPETIERERPVYKTLDLARLRALLAYDQASGVFTRRVAAGGRLIGEVAGVVHRPSGYRFIAVDGKRTTAHRIAWFYVYGTWPSEIDHINGRRDDNRIANLREATRSQQMANAGKHRDNTTGYKGVRRIRRTNRYQAMIQFKRKRVCLGTFASAEAAHEAYEKAAKEMFGEYRGKR